MVVIIVVGIVMALFTGLIFLTKPRRTTKENLVVAFMVALIIPMLEKLILESGLPIPYFQASIFSGLPLTFGPFLYYYTQGSIQEDFHFAKKKLVHFIPFGAIFLLQIGMLFAVLGGSAKIQVQGQNPGHAVLLNLLVMISLTIYTLVIFFLLRKHRQNMGEYFSVVSFGTTLRWLKWITLSFLASYLTVIVLTFSGFSSQWVPDLGTGLFIFAFAFGVIKQPELFHLKKTEDPEKPENKRYAKSGLKETQGKEIRTRLEELMNRKKPFLDPELTIVDLSQQMDLPRHYLTQIINEVFKKNFYQFINEYRIAEVKRRIDLGDAQRYSLLGLSLDCGFNSKSAFNLAFKSVEGCTPSEYRKRVLP